MTAAQPSVLVISPGYPSEMPFFVRGLARAGARVLGVGDSHPTALPAMAKAHLADYLQVPHLWSAPDVVRALKHWPATRGLDRVECLWEIGMLLAAEIRQALGVRGMTVDQTVPFRDKEAMKQVLDAADIRTPRHAAARTASEVREAARRIGYPVIVKPIAGAGSADTHRVDSEEHLEHVLQLVRHVPEVSVEEFIDGEEFTFDTVCANGEILYFNMSWYRPRPLVARTEEWISPQTIALRDVDAPHLAGGREMGRRVLRALGFRDGFTHMEWFLTSKGEAVFGEIGARPPGARSTDIMNYSCDFDVWTAWAEAVTRGRLSTPYRRRYNAAIVCKRAQGQGHIQRIEGLEGLRRDLGEHLVAVDLLPVGAHRRNWKQTLLSDGWVIVRHPELQRCLQMADAVGDRLQLYAG